MHLCLLCKLLRSINLSVCLSVCMFVYVSMSFVQTSKIYQSICLSVCLSVYLSIFCANFYDGSRQIWKILLRILFLFSPISELTFCKGAMTLNMTTYSITTPSRVYLIVTLIINVKLLLLIWTFMLSYSECFYNDTLHKRLIIYVMFRVYAEWLYSDCLYSECCYYIVNDVDATKSSS